MRGRDVNPKTKKERDKANRAINRAIDAIITLTDEGWGCDTTERILESLNSLKIQYELW
jgi:hypothetical protein